MAWLLAPAVVPAVYLLAAFAIARLVGRPGLPVVPSQSGSVADLANGGVGPWWFLALVVLGFAAAVVSAAGPGLALRRLRPEGPAVVLAARAAALAAVTMGLACAASVVAAVGLYLWAPAYAGYHESWPLAVYLPAVLLAVCRRGRQRRPRHPLPPVRPPRPDHGAGLTHEDHGHGRADHDAGDPGARRTGGRGSVSFGVATAVRDVAISIGIVLGLLYLLPVLAWSWAARGGTGIRSTAARSQPD